MGLVQHRWNGFQLSDLDLMLLYPLLESDPLYLDLGQLQPEVFGLRPVPLRLLQVLQVMVKGYLLPVGLPLQLLGELALQPGRVFFGHVHPALTIGDLHINSSRQQQGLQQKRKGISPWLHISTLGGDLPSVCQRCGQIVQDGMSFCANCGTQVMTPVGQGSYPTQPPPVYSVPPQFAHSPYYPYPGYYPPPNPKRNAAGGGCVLMILDGACALILTPFLLLEEVPVAGVFLLLACLVAIIGGSLALKGIMPILAAAGPPLLIIGAVWLIFLSPFFAMVSIIGICLAVISMALVVYGWSDLMARAEMRNRMARPY